MWYIDAWYIWWCTPWHILWYDSMMYIVTMVWWHFSMHYDVYLKHTPYIVDDDCKYSMMIVHAWWWLYILDDDCAYLMMIVHNGWWWFILDGIDAHLWWCKEKRIVWSMIVYDDVYKDVCKQCVAVPYTRMIWQW